MGRTAKRNYDRYTLAFKLQSVKLANHPNLTAMDIAESLWTHPVMPYRWRMEKNNGTLRENKNMKKKGRPLKKAKKQSDTMVEKDAELLKAKKRIKEFERSVASKQEELDILKKQSSPPPKTKQ